MSVLKLVCLSIMANPTNTITTRMTREIVNLKATEKNLLQIPGLLGLKKIKTNVQCKPNPQNDALPPNLKNLVKPRLSRVQATRFSGCQTRFTRLHHICKKDIPGKPGYPKNQGNQA